MNRYLTRDRLAVAAALARRWPLPRSCGRRANEPWQIDATQHVLLREQAC